MKSLIKMMMMMMMMEHWVNRSGAVGSHQNVFGLLAEHVKQNMSSHVVMSFILRERTGGGAKRSHLR